MGSGGGFGLEAHRPGTVELIKADEQSWEREEAMP